MVNPQRASGSLRGTRQIQRAIDQIRAEVVRLKSSKPETDSRVDAVLARLDEIDARVKTTEDLLIVGGEP